MIPFLTLEAPSQLRALAARSCCSRRRSPRRWCSLCSGCGQTAEARSGCCRPARRWPRWGSPGRWCRPRIRSWSASFSRRPGDRGVPSRRIEVRGLRERPQAGERDVLLQHRRQHRVTPSAPSRPASSSCGSGWAAARVAMIPVLAAAGLALFFVLRKLASAPAGGRRGEASRKAKTGSPGDGAPRRRDRAAQHPVVHAALAFVLPWAGRGARPPKADGNHLLFVMLLSGVGRDACAWACRRPDALRRTLVVTQIALLAADPRLRLCLGAAGVIALMLVGVCVVGTFGVTMVLSQLYLPRHVGMASGLSVGLAMGIGGDLGRSPSEPSPTPLIYALRSSPAP